MVGGLDIDLETQDKVAEEMLIGLLFLIGKVLDLDLYKAFSDKSSILGIEETCPLTNVILVGFYAHKKMNGETDNY